MSHLETIKAVYKKHLNFSEDDLAAVEVVFVSLISLSIKGFVDPLWFYIVGPPGGAKTEIVSPLRYLTDQCLLLSGMTENSFMSGYSDDEGEDPSLIKKLDGKLLVIKDLTALISENPITVKKVWGQLRDAYDGFCSKASGKEGLRTYASTFAVIACVTNQIDDYNEQNQQLGERFLTIRMHRHTALLDARLSYLAHIRKSIPTKSIWRNEITAAVIAGYNAVRERMTKNPKGLPVVTEEVGAIIDCIADCIGLLRTSTIRGSATTPEIPSRLVTQFTMAASIHAISDERDYITESDLSFIRRIALDTLSEIRRRIVQFLYTSYITSKGRAGMTIAQLKQGLPGINESHISNAITQFQHSNVVVITNTNRDNPSFAISGPAFRHIKKSSLFEEGLHNPHKIEPIDYSNSVIKHPLDEAYPDFIPQGA
jgi:hypothetical protein